MTTVSIPLNSRKVAVTCAECGTSFHRYPSDIKGEKQFCSHRCHVESASVTLTCAKCSTQFRRRRSKIKTTDNNFCSRECKGSSTERRCLTCGSKFRIAASQLKKGGNYCSRECHYKAHGRRVTDRGDGSAEIELTRGYVAVIDSADIPVVSGVSWQAKPHRNTVYAAGSIDGKSVLLHQLLIPGDNIVRDHIDGDGLNNRRSNLRIATHAQNLTNTGASPRSSTGVKGVSRTPGGRYSARINNRSLGVFDTINEAADAYNAAAKSAYGEFAYLNRTKQEVA